MKMSQDRYQALMDHLFRNSPALFLTFHEYISLNSANDMKTGTLEIKRPPNVTDRDYEDICAIVSGWK